MDHFLQIPQVGPEWQDMLDSYTVLGYLAARTTTIRLGALVTGITYRNLAHLAKIVATLDVISGGRAVCGLGAAWFEREHRLYGWDFPPVAQRFDRLRDALELLPMMWGPGSPRFEGRTITVAEAICYPRPLQPKVPVLVGGSGEKTTLRLVARYADACNLFGSPDAVRRKRSVLADHCEQVGRDIDDIRITNLSTVMIGGSAEVEALRPRSSSPEEFATRVNAGTVADHIGRFRQFAEAGVQTAIVNLPNLSPAAVNTFGEVIAAFPCGPQPGW
jgi:F420-dependent oxidoreductase-like protein